MKMYEPNVGLSGRKMRDNRKHPYVRVNNFMFENRPQNIFIKFMIFTFIFFSSQELKNLSDLRKSFYILCSFYVLLNLFSLCIK